MRNSKYIFTRENSVMMIKFGMYSVHVQKMKPSNCVCTLRSVGSDSKAIFDEFEGKLMHMTFLKTVSNSWYSHNFSINVRFHTSKWIIIFQHSRVILNGQQCRFWGNRGVTLLLHFLVSLLLI